MSTLLCTGFVKFVVTQYLSNETPVHGCFLDLSKAFGLDDHNLLFRRVLDRSLPLFIHCLFVNDLVLQSEHEGSMEWNSNIFVINGLCQGGVFSPILFAVYIDELLLQLKQLGVGCHWKHHFVDAVCYADDLALLAPSQAALRLMLCLCKLMVWYFIHLKLIRFGRQPSIYCFTVFSLCGTSIPFLNSIIHLGHILQYDLDDDMMTF